MCVSDLHLEGTDHDPDVVGPQLEVDDGNEALTTREYVLLFFVSEPESDATVPTAVKPW